MAASWEIAYRDNVGWVYGYVISRVGNRPDAEDITEDVFIRALPRLRSAAAPEQQRAYLVAVARTAIADHWRNGYDVELPRDVAASPPESGEDRHAHDDAEAGRAHRLLARLPDNYRRVLELRFLNRCSIRETAGQLGVTVSNAKVLQQRALRRAAELGLEDVL